MNVVRRISVGGHKSSMDVDEEGICGRTQNLMGVDEEGICGRT